MAKIKDCFSAGEYMILIIDCELPKSRFSFVKINDAVFSVTIPYDITNSIAIKANYDFKGQKIQFV